MTRREAAAAGRRILVTGLAGDLAGLLAARLEQDERVAFVAGIDRVEPSRSFARTEFVRAESSSPRAAELMRRLRIDTIVHLDITAEPGTAGGRQRMKEHNVIRTMRLLGVAGSTPGVRRVIVKSTTAVYGSNYADPALLREDVAPGPPAGGYARDAVEVEAYARGFARRRTDVDVCLLRFANFIGAGVDSVLGRYLMLPVVPTVLGYDPRIQLCHAFDAVEVLHRAATSDRRGIYNVAGPGIVYLSQLVRLAGKLNVPIPSPLIDPVASFVRRTGSIEVSREQLQFLLYGRVADISRLRSEFGYEPRYTTRAAVEEFIGTGSGASPAWRRALHAAEDRAVTALRRMQAGPS